MIFHTVYTISIDDFGLAFKRPKVIKRLPIWLPKKYLLKRFSRLVNEYNKLTNQDQNESVLSDKFMAVSFEMKIKALETVLKVLSNYWITQHVPQSILDLFKDYIGHEFNFEDFANEIQRVVNRINKMVDTYKNIIQNMEAPKSKEVDFLMMVTNIEGLIDQKIGIEKLYKLPYYIDKADKIIKSREHGLRNY